MELTTLVCEIAKRLDRIDFNALWPGFGRYPFALYNGKQAVMEDRAISVDGRFFGNTAIDFDGGKLAIWNVEMDPPPEGDLDRLTASICHEMFHAFQKEQGEDRWPDDLCALSYPMDADCFCLKFCENQWISQAWRLEPARAREALAQVSALRRIREKQLGPFAGCEYRAETVEGMAEYIGIRALDTLSSDKAQAQENRFVHIVSKISPVQLDVRRISYYSGALLMLAADRAGLDLAHSIGRCRQTIWELLDAALPTGAEPPDTAEYRESFRQLIEARKKELTEQIGRAKHGAAVSGSFIINGYDPMNMWRLGDDVLFTSFVALTDAVTGECVPLTGTTVVHLVKGETKLADWYARP